MGQNSTFFHKEKRNILITFVVFDFGYFIRFIWDEWYFWTEADTFAYVAVNIAVMTTDGITLLLLVLLHRQSFIRSDPQEPRLHLSPL